MNQQILKSKEEVRNWFVNRKDVMSFDYETTGLSSVTMQPVGISFCDGKRSCYIDLWENNDVQKIKEFLSQQFSSGCYISHNIKFDLLCSFTFGLTLPSSIFCTLTAAQLLNENRDSFSLKSLAIEELHVPAAEVKKWEETQQVGYHSDIWYKYCFHDAEWCFALYQKFLPQLKAQNLWYVFNQVEMPAQFALMEMEYNGVYVDQSKLRDLQKEVSDKLIDLEDKMLDICGKEAIIQFTFDGYERVLPINFNSSQQLQNIIESVCKLRITEKTKSGKKSVGKETLSLLKGKHEFIDLLIEYKKYTKLMDAYIIPAWNLIEKDGRIHPHCRTIKTGRLAFFDPNLQQLPNVSKKDHTYNYRRIFVSGLGNKLVGGDYKGQELRGLGVVTQDPVIIKTFRENLDMHLVSANYIFDLGLKSEELIDGTPEHDEAAKKFSFERYKAKNGVNFPIIYGTTSSGISKRQGVSKIEAENWISKFFKLYPNVKKAMVDTERELARNEYVTTLFGRKRRFPGFTCMSAKFKARAVRQAFNFKIQGLAADQVKLALGKMVQGFWKTPEWSAKLILSVHDEIVTECNNKYAEEVKQYMISIMENVISVEIPFEVDCKIGNSYDELK